MKETIIPLFAFIDQVRKTPAKLDVAERIQHFAAIYTQYAEHEAKEQSSRCLDCGNPYCQWQCPVHNYIPHWLKLVAEGKLMEAADLAHQTNTLPDVCGQVCPQEVLCEGACTLNGPLGAVTIGAIENYITETALNNGWKPDLSQIVKTNYHVGIIGAGPAGLACADKLVRKGIQATVYDRHPEIGGLLTFGIPQFKLEKKIITRRRRILEEMGIRFILNTSIDSNEQINAMHAQYDALFLAMGADQGIKANIPGEDLPGVYPALPFLITQIKSLLGLTPQPFDFKNKKVLILGAGDTAMDCSRTAIRLGADSVTCVSRRREEDRHGVKKDFVHAREEGVSFLWQQQAITLHGESKVEAVTLATTTMGSQGEILINDQQLQKRPVDIVIIAYGFEAKEVPWFASQKIKVKDNFLIQTSESLLFPLQTSQEKIFAGGDMVLGANLVVNAIAHGHLAAHSIHHFLTKTQR